jgi:hypothetical protein
MAATANAVQANIVAAGYGKQYVTATTERTALTCP